MGPQKFWNRIQPRQCGECRFFRETEKSRLVRVSAGPDADGEYPWVDLVGRCAFRRGDGLEGTFFDTAAACDQFDEAPDVD